MEGKRFLSILFLILTIFLSLGCSSGGGDEGDGDGDVIGTGVGPELNGTAAVGAPITRELVTLKGSNGVTITDETDDDGKFHFEDVSELTPPFLLSVGTPDGRRLFSIAANPDMSERANNRVNIHPLTDVISRNWFSSRGFDIEVEFENINNFNYPALADFQQQIIGLLDAIKSLLVSAFTQFNIETGFNFITDSFDANSTDSFDQLLDHIFIKIEEDKLTIKLKNPDSGYIAIIIINFNMLEDLSDEDDQPPSTPSNLTAIAANATSVVIVWNASIDNIGVAGYRIFRNNEEIAITPYPVYSDIELTTNEMVCYKVEAFDGSGNTSDSTDQTCVTPIGPDNTAPSAATDLTALATSANAISLTWTPSQDNDVVGYDIYRGDSGNVASKIATVVASYYEDFNLMPATQYCYKVIAFDAAGNRAEDDGSEACATTPNIADPKPTVPLYPPNVTGETPTSDVTPTWTWNSGGGGIGIFRYKLDDNNLDVGATTTSAKSFTPSSVLSDGTYTLYVQEQNNIGDWSVSGSHTIVIDTSLPLPTGPLAVDVSVSSTTLKSSTRVLYTVTVGNVSGTPIDNVSVQLQVPTNLSFSNGTDAQPNAGNCGTGGCTATETAIWNFGTLVIGESRTITINALAAEGLQNGATITTPFTVTAASINDVSINKTVTIYNTPSVDMAMSASTDPVTPGETFTFNVDVGNITAGPLATNLTSLQLRANLPDGVTIIDYDGGAADSGNGVIWDIASLLVGESLHREVTVMADNGLTAGTILRANAQLSRDVSSTVDNTAEHAVTVVPNTLPLSVDISTSANPVVESERVLYTLTVSNTSAQQVNTVSVQMRLPAELNFGDSTDAQPNATNCGAGGCTFREEAVWNLGDLAIGESRTISVNALVIDSVNYGSGKLINVPIRVTAAQQFDTINLIKTMAIYNSTSVDMAMSASTDPVTPGETFTFNVDIGNITSGALAANLTNLQLRAYLPEDVTIDDFGGGTSGTGNEVIWDIASLLVGESLHREVTVTANAGLAAGTILRASAQLTHDNGLAVDNKTAYAVTVVPNTLPLSVDISTSANPVIEGERVLYTLTVSNTSAQQINTVGVRMRLPVELNFGDSTDAQPNAGNCGTGGCTFREEAYWDLGNLAIGESRTISVNALVIDSVNYDSGTLINVPIRVTAAQQFDTINLVKTVAIYNSTSVDMAMSASTDPVTPGETFTFNVDIGNITSGALAANLTNLQLRAYLPEDVAINDLGGGTVGNTANEVVWDITNMLVGESLRYQVTVTANGGLAAGTILHANAQLTHDNGLAVDKIAEHAVTVVPTAPPLEVVVSATPNVVNPDRLDYTISVTNTSGQPVNTVSVMFRVPAELSFSNTAAADPDATNCGTGGCTFREEAIFNLGDIVDGTPRYITITATVDAAFESGNLITVPIRVTTTSLLDTINLIHTTAIQN